MYTRQDYMSRLCTHSEYYGQFVTPKIKRAVKDRWEADILSSNDEHFNNISVDSMAIHLHLHVAGINSVINGSRVSSQAACVCTIKEAMRQIVSEASVDKEHH